MPVIPDDYSEQLKKMGLPSYWEEVRNGSWIVKNVAEIAVFLRDALSGCKW